MNNKPAIGCFQTQTSNLLPTDVFSDLCQESQVLLLWNMRIFSLFPLSPLFLSLTQGSYGVAQANLELEFTEDDLEPLGLSGPPAFFTFSVWITGVRLSTCLCQAADQTQSFLCARQVLYQASHFPSAGIPWFSGEPLVS